MDRIVRVLATACDRENRAVPVAHAVVVGPDTVWLRLRTPDERPPTGWTAEQGGRTWHAPLRRLQNESVAESLTEPYPRLVSLGDTSKGFVLLNLSQAGGIISLEGDARQARALAEDWTHELTASPWSREVRVVRMGFKPGPAERFGSAEAPPLADGEAELGDETGGVALLTGLPGGRDRESLYRLAEDPEGRWSVVVLGRVDHPRWRFTIDATGVVDTGLLDEPVARRLNSAVDAPAHEEVDPDPVSPPVGRSAPENRLREQLFARPWVTIAAGVLACLVGGAVVLALNGSSSPSAPAAQASGTQAAAASKPTNSAPATGAATGTAAAATLVNSGAGKCLSGSAGTDGTPLILSACNGTATQKWAATSDGTIQTNGLCMDAAWGSTAPGTVVQVARCSGNPAQHFSLTSGMLYSAQAKLCAGAVNGGTAIQLLPCDQSAAELFKRG
ncbi:MULTISPECIES: RICIN domain-containing protein [unclassified Kitasatospora]|uniref:RICIN domain-containing protein n=1 Tax=unclassified Kitasatospora TaxID=2633591 RepID=UPI002472FF2C|nr:RICIN domain-containing protein [Kitasatospora sp. MAP12-44]